MLKVFIGRIYSFIIENRSFILIYYCFRDEINWAKKQTILGDGFWGKWNDDKQKYYLNKYKQCFDLWNETNRINVWEFRHKIKKISELSFFDANIPKINFENWKDLSDEDWLIPCDDDDWFNPMFKNHIESSKESLVYGDKFIFLSGLQNKFELESQKNKIKISSCGYALKIRDLRNMSFFKSLNLKNRKIKNSFSDAECVIKFHWFVKELIEKHNLNFKHIPEISCCKLWHPASFSEMTLESNYEILKKYKTPFVYQNKIKVTKELEWASGYINEYMKIIKNFSRIKF